MHLLNGKYATSGPSYHFGGPSLFPDVVMVDPAQYFNSCRLEKASKQRLTYNADHVLTPAAVAQDRLDDLAPSVGAAVLAAIRSAEFSFLLRSGKSSDRNRPMDGECADFFLGRIWTAFIPDDLHRRSRGSLADRPPHDWWHGIHVRSGLAAQSPPAEPVSCGHPAAAGLGDLSSGI